MPDESNQSDQSQSYGQAPAAPATAAPYAEPVAPLVQPMVVAPQPAEAPLPQAPAAPTEQPPQVVQQPAQPMVTPPTAPVAGPIVSGSPTSPAFPGEQPNPVQPTPAPGYNPYVQSPAGMTPSFNPSATGTGSKGKLIALSAVGLAAVAVIAFGGWFLLGQKISAADVAVAQKASDTLDSDVSAIDAKFIESSSIASQSELDSDISTVNDKLADAQKQVDILKKSHIQHDAEVKSSFKDFDSKWSSYSSYVQDDMSDMKSLTPVVLDFETAYTQLTESNPSSASEVVSELTSLKSSLDTASGKTANLKMKLKEDQQLLDAMKTYFSSLSTGISSLINDIHSGNESAYYDDGSKLDDADSAFNTASDNVRTQKDDHKKQVDPSSQFDDFRSALDKLDSKVGTK